MSYTLEPGGSQAVPSHGYVDGRYFDGRTSAAHRISLAVESGHVQLRAESWSRHVPVSELRLTEPSAQGTLLVYLADGSTCEFPQARRVYAVLREAGAPVQRSSFVLSVLEGDWRLAVMSIAFLAAAVAAFYVWLLPTVAEVMVSLVPVPVQARLGHAVVRNMEGNWLAPSALPMTQQKAIHQRFQQLLDKDKSQYVLYIRKFRQGPNAFALPGHIVVLTDELVTLVDGDMDTIAGVLAHELGHDEYNHGLRSVIQASALTVLGSALIGDYSSILATIPATLGHLSYSRTFEAEADAHSLALLCARGVDPARTALFFDKIAALPGSTEQLIPNYLMSHPNSPARAKLFRSGCQ